MDYQEPCAFLFFVFVLRITAWDTEVLFLGIKVRKCPEMDFDKNIIIEWLKSEHTLCIKFFWNVCFFENRVLKIKIVQIYIIYCKSTLEVFFLFLVSLFIKCWFTLYTISSGRNLMVSFIHLLIYLWCFVL